MQKMAIVHTERVRGLLDDLQRCNGKVRSLEEKVKMRDAEKMYIREGRDQCRADARKRGEAGNTRTVTVTFTASVQEAAQTTNVV
ncbi:hypothetical protein BDZ85DRAFT_124084 [Elsinoe ampelina]|uniref:Uncharacterized protein n=1 Tax=Elsinoe ampelina TaxID=302913 RepID=A0A6A6GBX1_9PEZI|nr:hypothetical protein BDZ85DRAFT_124084 [Elsinoe ampelina]